MDSSLSTTSPGLLPTITEPLLGFDHSPSGGSIIPDDPAITGSAAIDAMSLNELTDSPELGRDPAYRAAYLTRLRALAMADAEKKTEALLQRRYDAAKTRHSRSVLRRGRGAGHGIIHTESGVVGDMDVSGEATTISVQQTVQDVTAEETHATSAGEAVHATADGGRTQYSLDSFFERPVVIADGKWAVGSKPFEILSVWDLWSKDASVRAKLNNYAYFKGNLHVKISTSGTPFHYAQMLVSYQPYPTYNTNLVNWLSAHTAQTVQCINGYLSQAPGAAYINVRDNEPLVVDIPFISYKAKHRLWNSAGTLITNAVSFDDMAEAGDLFLTFLNHIRVANDDQAADVSYNVYCWATEVELGCVTSTDMDITAQSGTVPSGGDEYASPGPISGVATAVSKAGEALASVPVIGGFARATAQMASKVGSVAALFGWSKPVQLAAAIFVKNNPFSQGATVAGSDTVSKLTVDPKQELSVDQGYGGCDGEDCMAISAIASRQSFVSTFTWSDMDTALSTVLWTGLVTPSIFNAVEQNLVTMAQPTALHFASAPFVYWRGTIKYRFQFICSRFHRGRVLIKFEPNMAARSLISAAPARFNQQNTIIVDLQETQDVTVSCHWAATRAWCTVSHLNSLAQLDQAPTSIPDHPSPVVGELSDYNGYLEVRVLNDLVMPATGAEVDVNVWAWCDDLEVAVPSGRTLPMSRSYLTESAPSAVFDINSGASAPNVNLDHFGERITSFRALLKRYMTTDVTAFEAPGSNDGGYLRIAAPIYPEPSPRYDTDGSTLNSVRNNSLFAQLRLGFLGMRGGTRHRVIPCLGAKGSQVWTGQFANDMTRVTLEPATSGALPDPVASYKLVLAPLTEMMTSYWDSFLATLSGTVTFHAYSNGGFEFEVPYYSSDLFEFAFSGNRRAGASDPLGKIATWSKYWAAYLWVIVWSANRKLTTLIDFATAEDFTFLRFQGAPFYTNYVGGG